MFVDVTEALGNQMNELFFLLTTSLKKVGSKIIFSYEVIHKGLVSIRSFSIEDDSPDFIAGYFINYRDKFDIPYYRLVASLLFIDENRSLCLYGDKNSDLCIIGCSKEIFDNINELNLAFKNKQYFLNFMNVKEFLACQKKYLSKEEYTNIKEQALLNYS